MACYQIKYYNHDGWIFLTDNLQVIFHDLDLDQFTFISIVH